MDKPTTSKRSLNENEILEMIFDYEQSEHNSSSDIDDSDLDPDFVANSNESSSSSNNSNPNSANLLVQSNPPDDCIVASSISPDDQVGAETNSNDNFPPPPPPPILQNIWLPEIKLNPPFQFIGNPGVKIMPNDILNILDHFKLFFTDDLVDKIVNETNLYAEQLYQSMEISGKLKANSRIIKWYKLTKDELFIYFAMIILMGIVRKPQIELYWSKIFFINTPAFSSLMSINRFLNIRSCLHFSNNLTNDPNDKLAKLRPVVDHLQKKFREIYIPNSQIAIDEILKKWKGRLSWRQFNPGKRERFGFKNFLLSEVGSSYTWNFLIYTGAGTNFTLEIPNAEINQTELNQSTNVVLKLMEDLLNQGYTITLDNWYNSPELADILCKFKTDSYGTLRNNRLNLPPNFKAIEPSKGEMIYFQNNRMTVFKWRDPMKKKKKIVSLISTIHDDEQIDTGRINRKRNERIIKPIIINDYNKTMGAVDQVSQLTDPYKSSRRGLKWFRKLFEYLFEITLLNSYIIYKKNNNSKMTHLDYLINIAEKIIEIHHHRPKRSRPTSIDFPQRMAAKESHFPSTIPPNPIKKKPSRTCKVCASRKLRRESRYCCVQCDSVALCIDPCFRLYHTVLHYDKESSSSSSSSEE